MRVLWLGVSAALLTSCVAAQGGALALDLTPHEEPDLFVPEVAASIRHRVEAGQTLYRIARTYGLSPDELATANGINDPRELKVGMELVVPGAKAPQAVAGAPAPQPPSPAERVTRGRALPGRERPMSTTLGRADGPLSWPLKGVLYARFGKKGREKHDGIDLAAPSGTPIKTAAEGRVLYAGEQRGYGLIVIVEHANGLITLYAHNRDLRVKAGQRVRPGQVVATVGESGRTSGPHLHFEVRKDGVPVDPLDFLGPLER